MFLPQGMTLILFYDLIVFYLSILFLFYCETA